MFERPRGSTDERLRKCKIDRMADVLRIGICGCGMIAEHHLNAMKLFASPVVVSVVIDPNEVGTSTIHKHMHHPFTSIF